MSSVPGEAPFEDASRTVDLSESQASMIRSEERLRITNQRVPVGKAVLRKVIVVEQRTITIEVAHEEVRLDYVPLTDEHGDVAAALHLALPELVMHEEQVVITKRIVPTERVRPRIVAVPGEYELTEDLRHDEIELARSIPTLGEGGSTA